MNTKQIRFIFIVTILVFALLTFPIWFNTVLPVIDRNLNAAVKVLENAWEFLKLVDNKLTEEFLRLLDKYVFRS